MSNLNKISNCRNRKIIFTRDGRKMSVSCGKCVDCLYLASQRQKSYCDCASMSHKYCVFFTLTYSDTYVPVMRLVEHKHDDGTSVILGIDCTKRPLKTKGKYGDYTKRFDHYGKIIHSFSGSFDDPDFQDFYVRSEAVPPPSHPRYSTFRPLPRYHLRYSFFGDAQNFIKRLRILVAAEFNENISFHITSEYGPETYRPHFHGLLFFDSDEFAKCYQEFISKSWKFGYCPAEFARESRAAGNYVSGYINSISTLPCFLQGDFIAPRRSHSQYMAKALSPYIRDYIYSDVSRAFGKATVLSPFGIYEWSPTSTNIGTLFPRCYGYDRKTPSQLYELYTIFDRLRKIYKTNKCSELAWRVLDDPHGRSLAFLRLLNIVEPSIIPYLSDSPYRPIPLKFSTYKDFITRSTTVTFKLTHFTPSDRPIFRLQLRDLYPMYQLYKGASHYSLNREFDNLDDDDITVYNRVYSAINLSRNFLSFNCASCSPVHVFKLILEYYERRPMKLLKFQYETMIDYFDKYRLIDYDIFFPLSSNPDWDYSKIYKQSSYIKMINSLKDSLLLKKMKVKSLNDTRFINL